MMIICDFSYTSQLSEWGGIVVAAPSFEVGKNMIQVNEGRLKIHTSP
jgi:hypothetical protein